MEVHNVKYDEVNKLLNDMYSKYININNTADARTPFIRETLTKISDGDIDDVDFGIKIENIDGTPTVVQKYNIDKSSFTDLIREAIYCKLGNIVVDASTAIDNTSGSKGYLKFVKSGTTPEAGKVKIEKNIDIRNNIICSINLINVFIDILEAYKNFMDDQKNLAHLKKQVNNIIIVNKNARKMADYSASPPTNLGYWVDGVSGVNKLATSTLFLSIDSYQVTGSNYDNTNKLLHDFIVKYDIINNIIDANNSSYAASEITSAHSPTNGLINLTDEVVSGPANSKVNYITGIVLTKTAAGIPIVKRAKSLSDTTKDFNLNDIDNTKIEASSGSSGIYEVLLKRDKELLKDFLNMIVNLDLVNRRTQIKGMLTYFKIIKEYLYIAITTGNLLFNSYHNTITISSQDNPVYPTDFTTNSPTSGGYAIKYLDKSVILTQSNSIYTNNQTTTNDVESLKPDNADNPSDISDRYKKSIFGLAKDENDKDGGYVQKIIENIQDLQNIGAEETRISTNSTFDFSDSGFIAIIETDSTIRITSRAIFLKNQMTGKQGNLNGMIYATDPDGAQPNDSSFVSDSTFNTSLVNDAAKNGNMSYKIKNYLLD